MNIMAKMHEDELPIEEKLVYRLLKSQCPILSHLSLKPVVSNGTDHALFKLGNDYVVRLPRIDPNSRVSDNIKKECQWLVTIAKLLSTPISEPIYQGSPEVFYPYVWAINKWHNGQNPCFEISNEYALLAKDLAIFLNELHAIRLANGPISRRGLPLNSVDIETINAIKQLEEEINIQSVSMLWKRLLITPSWNKPSVWVHGDLLPGNIIVQNNRLTAIIDFSDIGMGDPSCDLIIAWCLFNEESRIIFRNHLNEIDDDTWQRGKAWALSIALIILPYYRDTNPALVMLAKRIIENIMLDQVD
jgi:aminoglycoside phosphotransferase (APT) family kinase protein